MPDTSDSFSRPLLGGFFLVLSLSVVGWLVFKEQASANEAAVAQPPMAFSSKSAAPAEEAGAFFSDGKPGSEAKPAAAAKGLPAWRDPAIATMATAFVLAPFDKQDPETLLRLRAYALVAADEAPAQFRMADWLASTSKSIAPVKQDNDKLWQARRQKLIAGCEQQLSAKGRSFPVAGEVLAEAWGVSPTNLDLKGLEQLQSFLKAQADMHKSGALAYSSKSMAPIPARDLPPILKLVNAELARRKAAAARQDQK